MKYYLFNKDCEFHLVQNKDIKNINDHNDCWIIKPFLLEGPIYKPFKHPKDTIKSFSLKEARCYKIFIEKIEYCFKQTPIQIRRRDVN